MKNQMKREEMENATYAALLQSMLTLGWDAYDGTKILHLRPTNSSVNVDDFLMTLVDIDDLYDEICSAQGRYFAQLYDEPFEDSDLIADDEIDEDGNETVNLKGFKASKSFEFKEEILNSKSSYGHNWKCSSRDKHFDLNNDLFLSKCKAGICLFSLFHHYFTESDSSRIAIRQFGHYLRESEPITHRLDLVHFFTDDQPPYITKCKAIVLTLEIKLVEDLNDGNNVAFQLEAIDFVQEEELDVINVGQLITPDIVQEHKINRLKRGLSNGKKNNRNQRDDSIH